MSAFETRYDRTLVTSDREALARDLKAVCRLEGEFTLRSGIKTNFYFDKYQFLSNPDLLVRVNNQLCYLLEKNRVLVTDMLAGLETGGIPMAFVLAHIMGCRAVVVRKNRKAYGTCKIVEGCSVQGCSVLVMEDVITTGGAVFAAVDELRKEGAVVHTVACAIFRGDDKVRSAFKERDIALVHAFTADDLK